VERAIERRRQHVAPFGRRHAFERRTRGAPRPLLTQDVEPAEAGDRRGDHRVDGSGIGNVGDACERLSAAASISRATASISPRFDRALTHAPNALRRERQGDRTPSCGPSR
jgi:hypothetical protein